MNIDAQHSQGIGKGREYLTPQEYKRAKIKMTEQIETELQPLRDELQEYVDIQRDFQDMTIQSKKIPFTKNVVVSSSELQEIESQAKSYRAVRSQIATLNDREKNIVEKETELQIKESELVTREKNCQKNEMAFDRMKKALEKAEKDIKRYLSELSYKKSELTEVTMELEDIKDELDNSREKYNSLQKAARMDCYLIKDFAVALKMLLFAESSSYKANLTEEQANLIKGIINMAKELLDKRKMIQTCAEIDNKCEISDLILMEIKKLTPPKNQPMFSMERVKSDEFKPTSESSTYTKPIHRGR